MKRILRFINWRLILVSTLLFVMLPTSAIWAAVFICYITLKNESAITYNYTPIIMQQDNNWISTHGYSSSSMLDVRIADGSGAILPAMYADDKTLFVPSVIPANSISQYVWSSGNTALTSHDIVVGYGGYITTADDAALEPGNNFEVEVSGYFDASDGADKNIFIKASALKLYISAANTVTGDMNGTTTVVTGALSTGTHVIKLSADSVNLYLYVDNILLDTTALAGDSTPDNANNIIWGQSNSVKYFDYIKWSN